MVSNGVVIKMLNRAVVIWRLDCGWRICFQDGALTWLMAGSLSSRPREDHAGLLKNPQDVAASFLRSEWSQVETVRQTPQVFRNSASELTYHHFCCNPSVTQTNADTVWERTTQGTNARKWRSIGAILEAGNHTGGGGGRWAKLRKMWKIV